MKAPTAPKDPTVKRPELFLMIDRDIAGLLMEDGTYSDVNYMEGRMPQQIEGICPNVDKEIVKLTESVEGIVKLVHDISVSIQAGAEEEKDEIVEFIINCYGKTDKYSTGKTLSVECPCNGEEVLIPVSECGFSDEDDIIGDFRFIFKGKCKKASVTLKFCLNDGYDVPKVEVDPPVDFESKAYEEMIDRSLLSTGNTYRLKKAIEKAKNGEEVTIAYIGGSITQGAGAKPITTECYAYLSYLGFCDLFTNGDTSKVKYVKAGVGGTPSELGMIRYDRDVLDYGLNKPDIVIVEFAVNDEGDETKGVCFESLIRKIAKGPGTPAVIINFAVFMSDWNLEKRLVPVGEHYDLPMVSVRQAVVPQFTKDTCITKRQYFYDIYHPTNTGHRIMADCLINLFKAVDAKDKSEKDSDFGIEPLLGGGFEDVKLLDRTNLDIVADVKCKGFLDIDSDIQKVERNLDDFATPQFPQHYSKQNREEDAFFDMSITCKKLLLVFKDSGNPLFGNADISVDGEVVYTAKPLEEGWSHCNAKIIIDEEESKKHDVHISMSEGDRDKYFTILGFGLCK